MGKTFKINHNRPDCIGCAACAAVAPETWEMKDDGKSSIIGGSTDDKEWEHMDFPEEQFEKQKEAADSCPVNVIHIIDKDSDEQII
ncbi:MAG: ferredoxin [archaeon]